MSGPWRPAGGGLSRSQVLRLIKQFGGGSTPQGGRLVTNASANLGAPPNYAYTASGDEGVIFIDADPSGASFTLTLPPISSLEPGQLVGLYAPLGNPNSQISLQPATGDVVVPPDFVGGPGPGSPLQFATGTVSTGARMVWEALQPGGAFQPTWLPRWDLASFGGGGGGGGDWATTLAAGRFSGGTDPTLSPNDALITSELNVSPDQDYGRVLGTSVSITAAGAGPVVAGIIGSFPLSFSGVLIVQTDLVVRRPSAPTTAWATLKEAWQLDGTLLATILSQGSAGGVPGAYGFLSHDVNAGTGQVSFTFDVDRGDDYTVTAQHHLVITSDSGNN